MMSEEIWLSGAQIPSDAKLNAVSDPVGQSRLGMVPLGLKTRASFLAWHSPGHTHADSADGKMRVQPKPHQGRSTAFFLKYPTHAPKMKVKGVFIMSDFYNNI